MQITAWITYSNTYSKEQQGLPVVILASNYHTRDYTVYGISYAMLLLNIRGSAVFKHKCTWGSHNKKSIPGVIEQQCLTPQVYFVALQLILNVYFSPFETKCNLMISPPTSTIFSLWTRPPKLPSPCEIFVGLRIPLCINLLLPYLTIAMHTCTTIQSFSFDITPSNCTKNSVFSLWLASCSLPVLDDILLSICGSVKQPFQPSH